MLGFDTGGRGGGGGGAGLPGSGLILDLVAPLVAAKSRTAHDYQSAIEHRRIIEHGINCHNY